METKIHDQSPKALSDLKQQLFSLRFDDPDTRKHLLEGPYYDVLLYDGLFRRYGCKPRGALYLGAHKGEMLWTLVLLGFKHVLLVEPQPDLFKRLQKNVALVEQLLQCYDDFVDGEPKASIQAVQCAVSDSNSEATFYVTSESMLSSLSKPLTESLAQPSYSVQDATVTREITVPTQTLDHLVAQSSGSPSDFNFLYMNIQGAELQALEGASEILPHLDCIYLENNLVSRYESCPEPEEIDTFLKTSHFHKAWGLRDLEYGTSYDLYVKMPPQ